MHPPRSSLRGALALPVLLVLLGRAHAQAVNFPHGGAPCTTDFDCSLGGECLPVPGNSSQLACACDVWMTGPSCQYLNLQRPDTFPGSQGLDLRGQNYYSWGGHSTFDEASGLYHGYFSFMCDHNNLGEWTTASSIVHATANASSPAGPYTFSEMIVQPWAHNAILRVDGFTGDYLVFHIGDAHVDPSKWSPCFTNGSTSSVPETTTSSGRRLKQRDRPRTTPADRAGDGVYVHTSPGPNGPWTFFNNGTSLSFNLTGMWATGITNPTPFIFPNGTTILYVAGTPCPPNWENLSPSCIGALRADSWQGPYTPLTTLPLFKKEGEDPFVFQDPRGNLHLVLNSNNCHSRCAAGVPCGGHAWSADGITWSEQFIGAFGPVFTTSDLQVHVAAYIERPQILQDPVSKVPIAFFGGLGVNNYLDSMSWSQLFCAAGMDPVRDCGPLVPPPPVPPMAVQFVHGPTGLCLSTNTSFPCPGGWADSCPTFLDACTSPTSTWFVRGDVVNGTAPPMSSFPLTNAANASNAVNVDCNKCAPNTVTKSMSSGESDAFVFLPSGGTGGSLVGSLSIASCGTGDAAMCLNGGQGPAVPPCDPGEFYMPTGQLQLESCSSPDAKWVWEMRVV
jgi:hypothetical protein